MTPAEQASPLAEVTDALPQQLLSDGEEILLATRPSVWSIVLTSWPWIVLGGGSVALLLLVTHMAGLEGEGRHRPLAALLLIAVLARLVVASVGWAGKLYLVTNLRLLTVRGLARPEVDGVPLVHLRDVSLCISPGERVLGLGSLLIEAVSNDQPLREAVWQHLSNPGRIQSLIEDAASRAQGLP
jgi:hypothetical protein